MAQFFCPSRFRKYVHFLGKTSWHDRWDYYITGICSEYAPKPPQSLAKILKIAKIDMEAKNLQDSDFDENDTIESEKFKELNGDIFSIWFFFSNELQAI